jgi:hypothetical protein
MTEAIQEIERIELLANEASKRAVRSGRKYIDALRMLQSELRRENIAISDSHLQSILTLAYSRASESYEVNVAYKAKRKTQRAAQSVA